MSSVKKRSHSGSSPSRKRQKTKSSRSPPRYSPLQSFVPNLSESLSPKSLAEMERYFYKDHASYLNYSNCVGSAIEYIVNVLFKDRKRIRVIPKTAVNELFPNVYVILLHDLSAGKCFFKHLVIEETLKKYFFDPEVELILIPFTILRSAIDEKGLEPTGHQNLLVIDKHNPTIEFYDPNGSEYHHMRNGKRVINSVLEKISEFVPLTEFNILEYENTCPSRGIQMYEQNNYDPNEIAGYCVLWTLFLLHLRIKYHKSNPKHVQEHYISALQERSIVPDAPNISNVSTLQSWWNVLQEKVGRKKQAEDHFLKFIKKYAYFMFKQAKKYNSNSV